MDNKGYVMGGLAFLLIIPSILLLIASSKYDNLDESANIMIKLTLHFIFLGMLKGIYQF